MRVIMIRITMLLVRRRMKKRMRHNCKKGVSHNRNVTPITMNSRKLKDGSRTLGFPLHE